MTKAGLVDAESVLDCTELCSCFVDDLCHRE
jgi:hypothetical protein